MITLDGKNLSERHKDLNLKVNEAFENKLDFQKVKSTQEHTDVDRLFKINLASKYKDIDYIIEQLKCGNSLYISKALKCDWIYGNEYEHIVNPEYLHDNIFLKMSSKMKTKTLSTISIYVRDETRTQLFYEYCTKENMTNCAYKFLIFTSESFKQEYLSNKVNFINICYEETCKKLIGNSFLLADTYGKMGGLIKNLSNMYFVDEETYLDLYEKYTTRLYYVPSVRVGVKMSKSILKKHKSRVLKNPPLYLSLLKQSEVIKYSSSDDAKVYAKSLLPKTVNDFWGINFCVSYKYIFDLIKTEKFQFIKKLFSEQYPSEEFETSENFYKYSYYNFMDTDEKETWALMHLKEHLGVVPEDKKIHLYKIVRFSKAFEEMKKQILIAFDMNKRFELLNILVKSAKTLREIEELLNYYYEAHLNEEEDRTQTFIRDIIFHHNVLDFDDACWQAFEKLLNRLRIYSSIPEYNTLLNLSIVYHILRKKAFPRDLNHYLLEKNFYYFLNLPPLDKLKKEEKVVIYDYMFKLYMDKISAFESKDYNDTVKNEVRMYLNKLARLKYYFANNDDYPDLALKFMKLDIEHFKYNPALETIVITEGYLLRCLKHDPSLVLDKFPLIQEKLEREKGMRINTFLKKLKTYFSNDLGRQYLELCTKSLYSIRPFKAVFKQKLINANVFAIFALGDERDKIELMDVHAPSRKKIDFDNINIRVYFTQNAICRFHCYSCPPVPLSKTRLYLKGEYLKECKPIFSMYLAHLTPSLLTEFIKLLLISPLPVQKIGLWLAFYVSKTSGKRNLVSIVWMKIKNVLLRKNLYKLLIERLRNDSMEDNKRLFEVLMDVTSHVNQDDDEEVFKYFRGSKIPEYLRGAYLQTAWNAVSALPDYNSWNIQRRTLVMKAMESNISLLDDMFVTSFVKDYFQKKWLELKRGAKINDSLAVTKLKDATWNFVIEYIVNIPNDEKQEKSLNIVKEVTNVCFDNWSVKYAEECDFQLFFISFVNKLDESTSCSGPEYSRIIHIFEFLLNAFEERIGVTEMYSYFWDWQLLLLTRKVIDGREECDKEVHVHFGVELGKFVIKLKEKNCYFISFLRKIIGKLSRFLEILCDLKTSALTDRYVKILVAYGLTQHELFETYVLALEILPEDLSICPVNETELREVIKRIRRQNNAELTALMNDKFIYNDLEERKRKLDGEQN